MWRGSCEGEVSDVVFKSGQNGNVMVETCSRNVKQTLKGEDVGLGCPL